MKPLGGPPLGGMLVYRRLPALTICWYPFIHPDGERHCESKVSCPRTQHNNQAGARTWTARSEIQRANHNSHVLQLPLCVMRCIQIITEASWCLHLPVPSNNNNDPLQTQHLADLCRVTITSHQDMMTVTIKIPDLKRVTNNKILTVNVGVLWYVH